MALPPAAGAPPGPEPAGLELPGAEPNRGRLADRGRAGSSLLLIPPRQFPSPLRASESWAYWEAKSSRTGRCGPGGAALALGGAFLVKLSIDYGWPTPAVRVLLGALRGIALAAGAEWLRRCEPAEAAVSPLRRRWRRQARRRCSRRSMPRISSMACSRPGLPLPCSRLRPARRWRCRCGTVRSSRRSVWSAPMSCRCWSRATLRMPCRCSRIWGS